MAVAVFFEPKEMVQAPENRLQDLRLSQGACVWN